MPLSTDEKTLKLSRDVLQAFDGVNGGVHSGFRPAHAKGVLLSGVFRPAPGAVALSRAPHLQLAETPVVARFSNFAGLPTVADADPRGASPRGFAVRFQLAEHVHTDIVAHSTDGFPTRTAEEFLQFLHAVSAVATAGEHPNAIERFLATHPAALAFVQAPKPIPTSFARESYLAVSAFKFTNSDGVSRFGRYRILPAAGNEYMDEARAAAMGPNFLLDEIQQRVARDGVKFRIAVQLAARDDVTDDATVRWPETREQIALGEITLDGVATNNAGEQQRIIFDPIPRVDGIETSADPLFEPRANVYLLSGRRRRTAEQSR